MSQWSGPFSWWIPVSIAVFVTSIVAMTVSVLATGEHSVFNWLVLLLAIFASMDIFVPVSKQSLLSSWNYGEKYAKY